MKVGQQRLHSPELERRINKNISHAVAWLYLVKALHQSFQGPHRRCPYRQNFSGGVDPRRIGRCDVESFVMHLMVSDIRNFRGSESSDTHVKSEKFVRNPAQ